MTPERFRQIRRLFEAGHALPESDWDAFLTRECAGDRELSATVRDLLDRTRSGQRSSSNLVMSWGGDMPRTAALVGRRVGSFTLVEVLGHGGFGTVYAAQQERPQRRVAVKLVRRRRGLSDAAWQRSLRRFELEEEILARLHHPGIGQIYEVGQADLGEGPQQYFAMELISGTPITQYAAGQRSGGGGSVTPLSRDARLDLLAQVAEAVQHAHQRGIIHRDLKPANVLVTDEGQAKLLDFGVARVSEGDLVTLQQSADAGEFLGTLAYMAPEQLSAGHQEVDTRADVYALGVIAFELLTGQLPLDVQGKWIGEVAALKAEHDPLQLGDLIPRLQDTDLEFVVCKTLHRDRAARYATAAEFAGDLRRIISGDLLPSRKPTRWRQILHFCRRNAGLVTGVAVAFLVLIGALGMVWSARQAALAEAENARAARAAEREARGAQQLETIRLRAQRGQWRAVLEESDTALREGFGDPYELRLRRIAGFDALNLAEEARAEIDRLFDSGPPPEWESAVLTWKGEYELDDPDTYAQGLERLKEALALARSRDEAAFIEALLSEEIPQSIALLQESLGIHPYRLRAWQLLGMMQVFAGRVSEGASSFRVAAVLFPDDPTLPLGEAIAQAFLLDREAARRAIERVPGMPAQERAFLVAAVSLITDVLDALRRDLSAEEREQLLEQLLARAGLLYFAARSTISDVQTSPLSQSSFKRLLPAFNRSWGVVLGMVFSNSIDADALAAVAKANPEGGILFYHSLALRQQGAMRPAFDVALHAVDAPHMLDIRNFCKIAAVELGSALATHDEQGLTRGEQARLTQFVRELTVSTQCPVDRLTGLADQVAVIDPVLASTLHDRARSQVPDAPAARE